MNKLTFLASYGDETRTVRIESPSGGGGSYSIMEQWEGETTWLVLGAVVNYLESGWTVVGNFKEAFNRSKRDLELDVKFKRRSFTMDDKQAILERMVEAGMFDPGDKVNW